MLHRLFRLAASLPLAVGLLTAFALCLAGATVVESQFGGRAAQDLVYRTGWFSLLLALLAGNVLCAALKKWPWKRRQVGFLLTHLGLLVLLFGGLLTACLGVEGQLVLVDTPSPELQRRIGLANEGATLYVDGVQHVDVFRIDPTSADERALVDLVRAIDRGEPAAGVAPKALRDSWSFPVRPGPFPWRSDESVRRELPWSIEGLALLAGLPSRRDYDLGPDVTLTLTNFYPHAEVEVRDGERRLTPRSLAPGAEGADRLTSAVRGRVQVGGRGQDFWAALADGRATRLRVGSDFFLVRYRPASLTLPFSLTLQQARRRQDPGSDRPAAFESAVRVTDRSTAVVRDELVSMNRPLHHAGFKVYQSNYQRIVDPETDRPVRDGDRPVSLSGLTVAADPGLWFKYAGTGVVGLGIATMFYMKAYFFERRRPAGRDPGGPGNAETTTVCDFAATSRPTAP